MLLKESVDFLSIDGERVFIFTIFRGVCRFRNFYPPAEEPVGDIVIVFVCSSVCLSFCLVPYNHKTLKAFEI